MVLGFSRPNNDLFMILTEFFQKSVVICVLKCFLVCRVRQVTVGFVAVVAIIGKLQCDWSVPWEIRLMFGGGRLSVKKPTGCSLMPI
jgi:hypothetical protein